MKTMNFFVGIPPPLIFSDKVVAFQKTITGNTMPELVEPHITIKAQGGLDDELKWVGNVKEVCRNTHPFEISILDPATFDDNVLYLRVDSEVIIQLHKDIVLKIHPSKEDLEGFFELDQFVPHLTLGISNDTLTTEIIREMRKKAHDVFSTPYKFMA